MSDRVYPNVICGTGRGKGLGYRATIVLSYNKMKSYSPASNKQKWRPFLLWAIFTANHWAWRENRKINIWWKRNNRANAYNRTVK